MTQENKKDKDHPGVSICTNEKIDEKVIHVLDKGRNFVPAPKNVNEVKFEAQVGIERLAYAMRCRDAQKRRTEYAENNEMSESSLQKKEYEVHAIKDVTKYMKKEVFAVRCGERKTEEQIKKLRGSIQGDIRKIEKKSFSKNMKEEDWKSLKVLKENEKVSVVMSDKTNKICIVDRAIAQEKQAEITNKDSFELIEKDPCKKITKSLNELISEIFCETSIPTYYFKILKTQHAECPEIYALTKDHKPTWPDCKARAVMPMRNSPIEKIDILVSKILTQYSPYLTYRMKNTEEVIQGLKNCKLKEGEFMFSLDVEAMFDNTPTCEKAIKVIKDFMEKHSEHINFFWF